MSERDKKCHALRAGLLCGPCGRRVSSIKNRRLQHGEACVCKYAGYCCPRACALSAAAGGGAAAHAFEACAVAHEGELLACRAGIRGDLVVFVPQESRIESPVIRKAAGERTIPVVPVVRKYHLKLDPPEQAMPEGNWERLAGLVDSRFHLGPLDIDYCALVSLGKVMRDRVPEITVSVWDEKEIIHVERTLASTAGTAAEPLAEGTIAAETHFAKNIIEVGTPENILLAVALVEPA